MRPRDRSEAERIDAVLAAYHRYNRPLSGIQSPSRRTAFLEQLIESIHRVQYIDRGVLHRRDQERQLAPQRLDPNSYLFDPIKGAAIRAGEGDHDEACWLVFMFTHFGKNLRTGYRLARDVYGSLGNGTAWDWARTSANPEAFRKWLAANVQALRHRTDHGSFGNHRKYQSLDPESPNGTGQAVVSYVNWVLAHRRHQDLFDNAAIEAHYSKRAAFDYLYRSMNVVASFGRVAKVDYLCMLGKLRLADIEPGSTYMTGSTGPLAGARLLFGDQATNSAPREIDRWLVELEARLRLSMGMQVLEDALCNWQKSPDQFLAFRG
jgi:hypothetical protein